MNCSWRTTSLRSLGARNLASWVVVAGATGMLVLGLVMPFLRVPFRFGPVSVHDAALAIAAGAGSLLWFELVKVVRAAWLEEPGELR